MSNDDQLDEQLRRLARRSIEHRASAVDADAAFSDRPGPLDSSRSSKRSHHRWLAAAAAAAVAVAGVAALAWPRGETDPVRVATETVAAPPVATGSASSTTEPVSSTTTSVTAVTAATADCEATPLTPPSLVDGTPPGEPVVEEQEGARFVRWGPSDSPFSVLQSLGSPIDVSWLDDALERGRAITAGDWQATTVAVGDPPISYITIYLRDTASGCVRGYSVGPGLFSDQAEALAQNWITALSTGSPTPAVGHADIGAPYFGRRITPLDVPPFEIDEFTATGVVTATLTNDQVSALFADKALGDGTTVRLGGTRPDGRCINRPLIVSGAAQPEDVTAAIAAARSIAVTASGTLLATRDVCPDGSRWGDPDTFSELLAVDPTTTNPTVATLRTWPSDPDQIAFDDGTIVIASGEYTLGEVSPDRRYVTLREQYDSDAARWELLDLNDAATPLSPPSSCDDPGDIVGPPRFVDDDLVVVARVCASATDADSDQGSAGDVRIEVIDLTSGPSGSSIVWSKSIPGLGVNAFTRTVDLSARQAGDGTVWAIVSGNGDFEVSSQTYALDSDTTIELTRIGYQDFAFQPTDLLTRFDSPPP
jgi:hypothetical protein